MTRRSRSRTRVSPAPDQLSAGRGERLQKVLAAAGIGSRRECEDLIREGRVEVDREVVTELGTRVDPARQEIRVDGIPLSQPKRVYFAVNKPPGAVSTARDPSGRLRVIDLVQSDQRMFTVGRLDRTSEGLIIVTNDGELADRLTHPRYGVEKTYLVRVAGHPSPAQLHKLRKGVYMAEGVVRVAALKVKAKYKESTDLEIVLNEGRNREIRRILARIGHKVLRLKRTGVGPLRLGELPVGGHRKLTPDEVRRLKYAAERTQGQHERARSGCAGSPRVAGAESSKPQRGGTRVGVSAGASKTQPQPPRPPSITNPYQMNIP